MKLWTSILIHIFDISHCSDTVVRWRLMFFFDCFTRQKEEKGSKDEQGPKDGVNDTEDSDEEKTNEGSKRGAPKGPRRKFIWTESVRLYMFKRVSKVFKIICKYDDN